MFVGCNRPPLDIPAGGGALSVLFEYEERVYCLNPSFQFVVRLFRTSRKDGFESVPAPPNKVLILF